MGIRLDYRSMCVFLNLKWWGFMRKIIGRVRLRLEGDLRNVVF